MSMIYTIMAAQQSQLEEAKKIVEENGMTFVQESKKYAGNHPVIDSDAFQKYLIQECGGCCGDKCDDEECKTCEICGKEGKTHRNALTGMCICDECEEEIK